MNNFEYYNPVKIVFGKDSINRLATLLSSDSRVLLVYGVSSIKKNGIYDKVVSILGEKLVLELAGISSNPSHIQCISIIDEVKDKKVNFILAVGGGSVIDASKYISAASNLEDSALAWELIIEQRKIITKALPIGVVLTMPASGSEMNQNSVISNISKKQKRSFRSEKVFPTFSILDSNLLKTLSKKQIAGGIVDAFSHVIEQYLTYSANSDLQDNYSEGILRVLFEVGNNLWEDDITSDTLDTLMWAASNALNGLIACGVPQDWSTHMIAHELTALSDINHPDSIAIILPGVISFMRDFKKDKIIQLGKNVFKINGSSDDEIITKTVDNVESFFKDLGQKVLLSDYSISKDIVTQLVERIKNYPVRLGERKNISYKEVESILLSRF